MNDAEALLRRGIEATITAPQDVKTIILPSWFTEDDLEHAAGSWPAVEFIRLEEKA